MGFVVAKCGHCTVVEVICGYVYDVLRPTLHQKGLLIIPPSNLAYNANERGRHRRGGSTGH